MTFNLINTMLNEIKTVKANTEYRVIKSVEFPGESFMPKLEAESVLLTDVQGQFNNVFTVPKYGTLSRTIPKYVLQTWLEDGRIEEVVPWVPKCGDNFYYVFGDGHVSIEERTIGSHMIEYLNIGNCFRTRGEAEKASVALREFFANLKK